ncbi:3BHS1-like protein, partial [Mya arenaria]
VKSVGNITRDSIKHPNKEGWVVSNKGKERSKITPFDNAGPEIEPTKESPGCRVLVTGGAGFLGQHLVSLLHTRVPDVHHISVLDLQPFSNLLDYKPVKPVRCYQGCITNTELLNEALAGVHTVYHIAGKISFGTFPDLKGMHWVNVKGTNCVIEACLANNVSRLIFCSTVDVVIGYDDIINGCEASVTTPRHFLFPGYPETKHLAEQEILKANGARTQNEGDPYYVTSGLKNAQQAGGILNQVGPGTARFQPVYVGNTAWAFTCADKALQENPNLGGQFYYVPDDTPVQNTFNFMKPFLEARGHQLSTFKLPYNLVYYSLLFAEWIAWVISPVYKISLPAESYSVRYINMDLFFSRKKAETELGFKPIFSPKKAIQMCLKYYRDLNL